MTTVILVHGAYAGSSSWDNVVNRLLEAGHRLICFANPLRSVRSDAALLSDLVRSVEGPVVLVGHSYGGAVISSVEARAGHVVAAVYVAGFALQPGESCADAAALAPGSTLSDTLTTVPLADGSADTYIEAGKYHQQFCADLSDEQAASMAVSQRPVTAAALAEPAADRDPLWSSVPSWFVFGELDRNIPAGAHHVMARRAGSRRTVEVSGASHVVGISHPAETVELIQLAVDTTSPTAAVA